MTQIILSVLLILSNGVALFAIWKTKKAIQEEREHMHKYMEATEGQVAIERKCFMELCSDFNKLHAENATLKERLAIAENRDGLTADIFRTIEDRFHARAFQVRKWDFKDIIWTINDVRRDMRKPEAK